MKRVIAVAIVVSVVMSFCVVSAYASPLCFENVKNTPPGLQKQGKVPPGLAKKAFDDADIFWWAQRAIEKLKTKGVVKGRANGLYDPKGNVTKLETIIMALRIMGWEDEAQKANKLPRNYKGGDVGQWAYGYINVAYEKGILDNVDMMYFEPSQPALRHEVAKYVIRALGYEDEARDSMNKKLPFDDASLVPAGSIGYVYLVNEMGLMIGNNNRFNPLGTLTRAEMAVLFQRLDEKVDSEIDEDEVRGEVVRLYDDRIRIKVDGAERTFEVSEDVIIYDRDKRIPYSDIPVGAYVVLELENDMVVFIEVIDRSAEDNKIIYKYNGTVVEVNKDKTELTLQNKQMKLIFKTTSNVEIWINGKKADFDDIKAGDLAEVTVDKNNRAREIRVEREKEPEPKPEPEPERIRGIITSIDLVGVFHLTISDMVYGGTRYGLDQGAIVFIENEEAELEDLDIGMYGEFTLDDDNIIQRIEIDIRQSSFEAEIVSVSDVMITVRRNNNTNETYLVSENLVIRKDGKSGYDIDDLEPGDDAVFTVLNNTITRISIN